MGVSGREKLQAAESWRGVKGGDGCWGWGAQSGEANRDIRDKMWHLEESVLVNFVSVKSQKNMLNIWGLIQRGEGSEGPLERVAGEVLEMSNTPGGEGGIEGNIETFVRWWKTFRKFYTQESLMNLENTAHCEK